ncbi:MAG: DUF6261 family protein [Tannerellaceae bacterium]|jgi:hypothetical protein|nr:DUF6261 family protein [Tannerellaceae bacterium]
MQKFILIVFKTLLGKLHIAEHADFYERGIIKPLIALMSVLPIASGVFNALRTVYQKEDDLFKQSQASILTPEITALHEKRIALLVFFWHYVSMSKYFDDAALVQATDKLMFLKNNYKELPQANYTDANGLLTNFLEDCEKAEWAPLIQALGLTSLVGKIKTAHEAFKDLYTDRSFDKTHIAQMGKISEIRVEVDATFDAFIDSLNAAWTANEFGAKDATVRSTLLEAKEHIIAAIHQAEVNLARRGVHKVKEDDKTDEGTQAPDTTNPPAPQTPPQQPDTTNPPAPPTPPQQPDTSIPPINPEDLNPPSAGE